MCIFSSPDVHLSPVPSEISTLVTVATHQFDAFVLQEIPGNGILPLEQLVIIAEY